MSMFHIWNPSFDPQHPKTVEIVLTRGDADSINKATTAFFSQVMDDMRIKAKVREWHVKQYRSKYYTDFLGEDDFWRDNWQIIWRATITLSEEIEKLPRYAIPWIETDAVDDTWKVMPDDDDATVGCLVVADFAAESALDTVKTLISSDLEAKKLREKYLVRSPSFATTRVLDKYEQLQIDLGDFGGKFFASGADYAERVIELCRKCKGTVHFAERL